ncbi:hypothetical protein AcW1_008646 [Taiwanofungus camphoratus]|nr:hypothetical protein AcV5_006665 [Antrodia cinnamomea]KAI0935436.1 hypothetical protein AcV7_003869 [Antrodia cinnamomea]KAI0948904.1 hypothetical protein AcW1_008646 [Antrodia cinnamomea]
MSKFIPSWDYLDNPRIVHISELQILLLVYACVTAGPLRSITLAASTPKTSSNTNAPYSITSFRRNEALEFYVSVKSHGLLLREPSAWCGFLGEILEISTQRGAG